MSGYWIAYLLVSLLVGYSRYKKIVKSDEYYASIPRGDLYLYEYKPVKIVTPLTLLFMPSIVVVFILSKLGR